MIGKKLRELREEKGLLQKDVANFLNISTSAYGYYEQGKRNPDIENLSKLADFFNVSTDYLLGKTNVKNTIKYDYEYQIKFETFSEIDEFITKKLVDEGIIKENEPTPKSAIEKSLKFGIDGAVEILKLEKELKKNDWGFSVIVFLFIISQSHL